MDEKLFNLIEQLAADVSIIKQDVKEIKSTVTKLEENEPEEIMAMLKLIKKDLERELRYTDKRFSEVDRKIYDLEERLNNWMKWRSNSTLGKESLLATHKL